MPLTPLNSGLNKPFNSNFGSNQATYKNLRFLGSDKSEEDSLSIDQKEKTAEPGLTNIQHSLKQKEELIRKFLRYEPQYSNEGKFLYISGEEAKTLETENQEPFEIITVNPKSSWWQKTLKVIAKPVEWVVNTFVDMWRGFTSWLGSFEFSSSTPEAEKIRFAEIIGDLEERPPIEGAIRLLTQATAILYQNSRLKESEWEKLGEMMKELLVQDISEKVAAIKENKEGHNTVDINLFEGIRTILNNKNCEPLHSYAITALGSLENLKNPDALTASRTRDGAEMILSYAGRHAYSNSSVANLREYIGIDSDKYENYRQEFSLSPREVEVIVKASKLISEEQFPDVYKNIKKELFNNGDIEISNIKKTSKGKPVFNPKGLDRSARTHLNSRLMELQIIYNKNVAAAFRLIDDVTSNSSDIRSGIFHYSLPDLIRKYPSGPLLTAYVGLLKDSGELLPESIKKLIELLDKPSARHIRLALADVLKSEVKKQPELDTLLNEKLNKYGITVSKDKTVYDNSNIQALKTRLAEVIKGQDKLLDKLGNELEKQSKDSRHTPFLCLDGGFGTGKTSTAEKLAVELNMDLERQQVTTDIDALHGNFAYNKFYNLHVINLNQAVLMSPDTFIGDISEQIIDTWEASKTFPEKSCLLLFDEFPEGVSCDKDVLEGDHELEKGQFFAKAVEELIQKKSFTDPVSHQVYPFENLIVFLTGNGTVTFSEDELLDKLPILNYIGDEGNSLKKLIIEGNNLHVMRSFTRRDLREITEYMMEIRLPAIGALQQIEISVPQDLAGKLSKSYFSPGVDPTGKSTEKPVPFNARYIEQHLTENLIVPILKGIYPAGATLNITVNDNSLGNFNQENLSGWLSEDERESGHSEPRPLFTWPLDKESAYLSAKAEASEEEEKKI